MITVGCMVRCPGSFTAIVESVHPTVFDFKDGRKFQSVKVRDKFGVQHTFPSTSLVKVKSDVFKPTRKEINRVKAMANHCILNVERTTCTSKPGIKALCLAAAERSSLQAFALAEVIATRGNLK